MVLYIDLHERYDEIRKLINIAYPQKITDKLLDQVAGEAFMYLRLRLPSRLSMFPSEMIDAMFSDMSRIENHLFDFMLVLMNNILLEYKINTRSITNFILRNNRLHIYVEE